MRKLLLILFSIVCASNATWANKETVNGIVWNFIIENGSAVIKKNNSSAIPTSTKGAITIPSSLGGYLVTSIGEQAFYYCSGLTSVTIPSSVTNIGDAAFMWCRGLTTITIPSNVTSIGYSTFYGCSGLTSVTIPSSVTSIGCGAFSECSHLTSITISSGVTSIDDSAFSNCTVLKSVTIPSSVTNIGSYVFSNCSGLTNVAFQTSVKDIGQLIFLGCNSLIKVVCYDGDIELMRTMLSNSGCNVDNIEFISLYKVIFNVGSHGSLTNSKDKEQYMLYGEYCVTPIVVSNNGWKFNGWNGDTTVAITKDITFTANWEQLKYKVDLDGVVDDTCVYGQTVKAETFASITNGYTNIVCLGWVGTGDVPANGTENSVSFTVTQASSLKWLYETNYWVSVVPSGNGMVTLKDAGGNSITNELWAIANTNFTAEAVANEGWLFGGWRDVENDEYCDTGKDYTLSVTHPWLLNAVFTSKVYTVTFDLGEHGTRTGGGELSQTIEWGNASVVPTFDSEVGWSFQGWDKNDSAPITNDTTFTANWEQIKYKVDLDGVVDDTCVYGQTVKAETFASITNGYTNLVCLGWVGTGDVPANGTENSVSFTVTQASSLKWLYETNYWVSVVPSGSGTVMLKDAGGNAITNELWAIANTNFTAEAVVNEGWLFVGWRDVEKDEYCGTNEDYALSVTRPWLLNAVFTSKVYTVTFDLGKYGTRTGGGELTQTIDWGNAAVAPEVDVEKTYQFEEWDVGFDSVKSNFVVKAKYISSTPYVGVLLADGCENMGKVSGANKNVKTKSKVTLKATANKGFVFAGWYDDVSNERLSQSASYAVEVGNHDINYYAQFIATTSDWCSVEFEAEDEYKTGLAIDPIAVAFEGGSLPTVKVTGLPTGLKWTDKLVTTKKTIGSGNNKVTTVVTNALPYTIYGTPTKSGVYTIVATVTTAGKQTASKSQTVVVRKDGENVVKAEAVVVDENGVFVSTEAVPGKITGTGIYTANKKVSLKATVNKGYVFAGWWNNEGGEVLPMDAPVSKSASLTIDKMPSNDVAYVAAFITSACDKSNIVTTVNGMVFDKGTDKIPLLQETNIWAGVYVQWPVVASALSETTVKVSGLPSGLKFTAKDVTQKIVTGKTAQTIVVVPANTIYGAPTAASKVGKPSAIKLVVTTAGKSTQTYQINATVDALPAWAQGTWTGFAYDVVSGDGDGEDSETTNGLATVTIAATGKISAKHSVNGKSASFAASYFDKYNADENAFYATLTAKVSNQVVTNEMVVSLQPETELGVIAADLFDAWQYNWKIEPWKTLAKKFNKLTYTYVIKDGGAISETAEDVAKALGDEIVGKVSLKFTTSGTVTVAGEFVTEYNKKTKKYTTVKASGSTVCVPKSDEQGTVFIYLAPKGLPVHLRVLEVAWPAGE